MLVVFTLKNKPFEFKNLYLQNKKFKTEQEYYTYIYDSVLNYVWFHLSEEDKNHFNNEIRNHPLPTIVNILNSSEN